MKRLSLFITLLAILALACNALQIQPTAETIPAETATSLPVQRESQSPFDSSRLGTVEKDVTYCTMDSVELKMDVYYPYANNGLFPVTMYVHGGGWSSGDKAQGAGAMEIPALRQAGFLVVSVNYRLAPEYKFPVMIEDVKCAVRFLRAHANDYNLDPDRIGVWGGSAGGHLVALLGTTDESAGFDVGEYLEYSSRVQAVVDMFGPTDLTVNFEGGYERSGRVFGDFDPALASPVTYVTPDDPPFLLLHGEKDKLVPIEQSEILLAALQQADVPAELVPVKNAGHSFKPDGGEISPTRRELGQMIVNFFEKALNL
jgi:acetyl esterase/lipase